MRLQAARSQGALREVMMLWEKDHLKDALRAARRATQLCDKMFQTQQSEYIHSILQGWTAADRNCAELAVSSRVAARSCRLAISKLVAPLTINSPPSAFLRPRYLL